MLLKTKLLLSLGTLGVAGGVGTGVYLLKNKEKENKAETNKEQNQPEEDGEDPKALDNKDLQTLDSQSRSDGENPVTDGSQPLTSKDPSTPLVPPASIIQP